MPDLSEVQSHVGIVLGQECQPAGPEEILGLAVLELGAFELRYERPRHIRLENEREVVGCRRIVVLVRLVLPVLFGDVVLLLRHPQLSRRKVRAAPSIDEEGLPDLPTYPGVRDDRSHPEDLDTFVPGASHPVEGIEEETSRSAFPDQVRS